MDKKKFDKKLESVIGQIKNSNFMFSRQRDGLIAVLKSLESETDNVDADSVELGKINYYLGKLLVDTLVDYEEAVERIKLSLKLNERHNFLSFNYVLSAYDALTFSSIKAGLFDEAENYIETIKTMLLNNPVEDDIRLGMLSQVGFYCHELELYSEALKINLSVLEEAKKLYGSQDSKLMSVTRNISENLYCLGRMSDAEKYQNEVIALAKHNNESEIEVLALYKIAVLNQESGDYKKANEYARLCLDAATRSGDESLIANAKLNIDELKIKMKKWWKFW